MRVNVFLIAEITDKREPLLQQMQQQQQMLANYYYLCPCELINFASAKNTSCVAFVMSPVRTVSVLRLAELPSQSMTLCYLNGEQRHLALGLLTF